MQKSSLLRLSCCIGSPLSTRVHVSRWLIRPSHASRPTRLVRQHNILARPLVSSRAPWSDEQRWLRTKSLANPLRYDASIRRHFSTASIAVYLTPPAVFVGLVLTLWVYKCLMMVVFQNKIIYMPSVPPFSRSEEIEAYTKECGSVQWREENIKSTDGTRLALAVGECQSAGFEVDNAKRDHLTIVYFQGNASSLPPRLPMLSSAMRSICSGPRPLSVTLVALSYRGFWKSSGRPSQAGIQKDAQAAIVWAHNLDHSTQKAESHGRKLVLWGQSIGAGVATQSAADLLKADGESSTTSRRPQIDALVLETPFTSVRGMLVGLYPQTWLPYRYLWPFLRNWWDSEEALKEISKQQDPPKLLILNAEKDEVVPHEHGEMLASLAGDLGYDVREKVVKGALHHEVMIRREGRQALAEFCQEVVR